MAWNYPPEPGVDPAYSLDWTEIQDASTIDLVRLQTFLLWQHDDTDDQLKDLLFIELDARFAK